MLLEKGQRQGHLIYLNSQVPEGFDVKRIDLLSEVKIL